MVEWTAALLSLVGIFLNAKKNIWCWPVWIASNFCWIAYSLYTQEWAVLITFGGFFLGNLYGWREWHGDHDYTFYDLSQTGGDRND